MVIRRAQKEDISDILRLLQQVLQIHADIRPDIFISGTTKYTEEELQERITHTEDPIFVAEIDGCVCGYIFCEKQGRAHSSNMTDITTLYIDDLCVDAEYRGRHIGHKLYEYAEKYAGKNGFYNITLNVWAGNDDAEIFYEKIGLKPQKTTLEKILK
ncbi:MAG: GNAT family N-acetyltransferase [Solobacterium sp.]|nr:GNAT family N-acetyltransferase [Solobacterium sp.]